MYIMYIFEYIISIYNSSIAVIEELNFDAINILNKYGGI
jgi:hypothetical protein